MEDKVTATVQALDEHGKPLGPKVDLDALIKGTKQQVEREAEGRARRQAAHQPPAGESPSQDSSQSVLTSEWFRHLAAEIIVQSLRKYHPHLDDAFIVVLSGPLGHGDGCKTLGRARRLKTIERSLLNLMSLAKAPDYVIEVSTEDWAILSDEQREALIDHEMCHLSGRERDKDGVWGPWKLRGHDLEEFAAVVHRHGLWRPSVRDMAHASQPYLPGIK